jgi:hypothetical protein
MGIIRSIIQVVCIHKLKILSIHQEGEKVTTISMCERCGATITKS